MPVWIGFIIDHVLRANLIDFEKTAYFTFLFNKFNLEPQDDELNIINTNILLYKQNLGQGEFSFQIYQQLKNMITN